MSATTTGKTDWFDQLDRAREVWDAIVAEAAGVGMERPGAAGDWTFKDVAGHLNGWRVRTVDRLEAAARGEAPPPAPWPNDFTDETDEGTEAINRWIYERNHDRPVEVILAEASDQFRRLRAAVEAISEENLVTPGRFPWLVDFPLSAVLAGSFEHLHEEHEPALRAWLSSRSG